MATTVGILTFLHNDNYGSTLQAWALQKTLRDLGYDALHLDYCPDTKEKILNLLRSGNSPMLVVEGLRKRHVRQQQDGAVAKHASFADFYAQHMRLTDPCPNQRALARAAAHCSVLMTGSDQVFSPVWLNPAYFLPFAEKHQRRMAYAPSLGVSQITSARKAKRMTRWLRDFEALSCREQEGAALLASLTGKTVPVLPDPVLLQHREAWLSLAENNVPAKPYLVTYFIGDNPAYWEKARDLAASLGLDILVIPVTQSAYAQPFDKAEGLSPQAWLGRLAGAAHVLTDSFHGTAFSLLMHRPHTILRRYAEDDPESKNSRLDQLMRSLQLTPNALPDWAEVDQRIAALREEGIHWLQTSLSSQQV